MMKLKERIVACLLAQGADLVGVGDVTRMGDGMIPRLMPQARSVVCVAFRVLRGSHRGIEDGTTYYQYTTMGVETLEENVMPLALLQACALLEDAGFSALPQRRHQTVRADEGGTNPEIDYEEIMRGRVTELELSFDQLAVSCGMGELGLHGGVLTEEYGPLVRLCAILTDALLPEDALRTPHLCDRCGACVAACPGRALSANGERDDWQCAAYYMGANMRKNPFLPPDALMDDPDRLAVLAGTANLSPERARMVIDQLIYYPPVKHGYTASICGRACHRACAVHLEQQGKLTVQYAHPLRRQSEWTLSMNLRECDGKITP